MKDDKTGKNLPKEIQKDKTFLGFSIYSIDCSIILINLVFVSYTYDEISYLESTRCCHPPIIHNYDRRQDIKSLPTEILKDKKINISGLQYVLKKDCGIILINYFFEL